MAHKKAQRSLDALYEGVEMSPAKEYASDYSLHTSSQADIQFKKLKKSLINWINTIIRGESSIVKDLNNDLLDGQILALFLSKISQKPISVPPALSPKSQRSNLLQINRYLKEQFNIEPKDRWSVDGIIERDIKSILCLLVDISHIFPCPYEIPSNISIAIIHDKLVQNAKVSKTTFHSITGDESPYQKNVLTSTKESLASNGSQSDLNSSLNMSQSRHSLNTSQSRQSMKGSQSQLAL